MNKLVSTKNLNISGFERGNKDGWKNRTYFDSKSSFDIVNKSGFANSNRNNSSVSINVNRSRNKIDVK